MLLLAEAGRALHLNQGNVSTSVSKLITGVRKSSLNANKLNRKLPLLSFQSFSHRPLVCIIYEAGEAFLATDLNLLCVQGVTFASTGEHG